jgi:methyltransferase (TIGR00027 family)
MALRSRYAEDELSGAIERGVFQYVILGAGLDSFAYRQRTPAPRLRVFEVDLPSAQHWKRERLRALKMSEPDGLVFVPLDLERQTLVEGLRAAGYRVEQPGFFSWLGATQYLTVNAVFETLTEIASLAPGSEVVFTYHVPEEALEGSERQVRRVLSARAARGEAPWISSFDPTRLAARLETMGLEAIDLGPDQAGPRYFAERTDDLVVPRLSRVMRARVRRGAEAR